MYRVQCYLLEHSTCKHQELLQTCPVCSLIKLHTGVQVSDIQINSFVIFLMEQEVIPVKGSIMNTDSSWGWILWCTSVEKNILYDFTVCGRQHILAFMKTFMDCSSRDVHLCSVHCQISPGCFVAGKLLKDFTCQKIYHAEKYSF